MVEIFKNPILDNFFQTFIQNFFVIRFFFEKMHKVSKFKSIWKSFVLFRMVECNFDSTLNTFFISIKKNSFILIFLKIFFFLSNCHRIVYFSTRSGVLKMIFFCVKILFTKSFLKINFNCKCLLIRGNSVYRITSLKNLK